MSNSDIDTLTNTAALLESLYQQLLSTTAHGPILKVILTHLYEVGKAAEANRFSSLTEFINQLELVTQLEVIQLVTNGSSPKHQHEVLKFFIACCNHLDSMIVTLSTSKIPEQFPGKKRVLIIDNSEIFQLLLSKIVQQNPNLHLSGVATSATEGEKLIATLHPDLITLDLHMAEMDGYTFLNKIIEKHPLPIVLISDAGQDSGKKIFHALYRGAVDFIPKSSINLSESSKKSISDRLYAAANVELSGLKTFYRTMQSPSTKPKLDLSKIVAIGAAVGSTRALIDLFSQLPAQIPPLLIIQSILPEFSHSLIQELNEICLFVVKEAQDGDIIIPNQVLIAPAHSHAFVEKENQQFKIKLNYGDPVQGHCPSIDVLFDSIALNYGDKAVGLLISGADTDGAAGLLEIRKEGGTTLALAESECAFAILSLEAIRNQSIKKLCGFASLGHSLTQALRLAGTDVTIEVSEKRIFSSPGPRVLVVDDSPTIRSIINNFLKDLGVIHLVEAKDGSTAWTLLIQSIIDKTPFDIVISDQVMPGIDGQTLLKKVRSHQELKNTPFILSTSMSDKKNVLSAIDSGVTGFITKPISFSNLAKKIKEIFNC